jgi:ribosome maturation factor RimP
MDDLQTESIRGLADPVLAASGAEVVELSVHRRGGQTMVRFLVDKVGGVTIQECAKLNRLIGQAIEEANLLLDSYTLEVSSPGLDRPFSSKRDYERAIGEDVDVLLNPDGRSKRIEGMLLSVQDQSIVVTTGSGNVTIPFGQIQVARKAIRF